MDWSHLSLKISTPTPFFADVGTELHRVTCSTNSTLQLFVSASINLNVHTQCSHAAFTYISSGLSLTLLSPLVAIIHLLPGLEEIDLSWNDLIGGTLKSLTLPFKCLQELKVLRLNNCRLTAMDLSFLGIIQ